MKHTDEMKKITAMAIAEAFVDKIERTEILFLPIHGGSWPADGKFSYEAKLDGGMGVHLSFYDEADSVTSIEAFVESGTIGEGLREIGVHFFKNDLADDVVRLSVWAGQDLEVPEVEVPRMATLLTNARTRGIECNGASFNLTSGDHRPSRPARKRSDLRSRRERSGQNR